MDLQLYDYEIKIREELKKDFKETYEKVFDSVGNIRNCGREECKKLIKKAEHIGIRGKQYGNKDIGFLDKQALKELYIILR